MQSLLSHGANPNTPDHRGWTPLISAVHHDHLETAQLLLSHNARIELKDSVQSSQFGKMALDRAKSQKMADLLQQALKSRRKHSKSVSFIELNKSTQGRSHSQSRFKPRSVCE